MRKQTKAEKIFRDTYYMCRKHLESWEYDGIGFNGMATEECVYTRTKNEIKKLIKSEETTVKMSYKYKIITLEEAKKRIQALALVAKTLENQYIS